MRETVIKIFVLFLFLFAYSGGAEAQTIDADKIKKIPRYGSDLSQEDFEKSSDVVREEPMGDKHMAFEIRLPKGWSKIEDITSDTETAAIEKGLKRRILGKVAHYHGPSRLDVISRIEVRALELDYNISAWNWFLNYIITSGYTIEGVEKVSPNRIEALYVLVERDTSHIVRTVAEVNGSRMVLVSYFLPENHWTEERAMQDKVIQSFHFLAAEEAKMETSRTYTFMNLLRFDYPVSWRLLSPSVNSLEGMDAKLINSVDNKTLTAEIGIRVVSTEIDTTLAQEVQYLRDEMKDMGLMIGNLIGVPEDYTFHDHLFFHRVEVYEANDKNNEAMNHELWLAILAEDRYYYIVTMLTPGRKASFYTWAKNTEAFRVVIESLRP